MVIDELERVLNHAKAAREAAQSALREGERLRFPREMLSLLSLALAWAVNCEYQTSLAIRHLHESADNRPEAQLTKAQVLQLIEKAWGD